MAKYYLKATDEQALWTALESAGIAQKQYDPEDDDNIRPEITSDDVVQDWSPSGAYTWTHGGYDLDIVGVIYSETGNTLTDDDGLEYPEMTALSGFHANLRADLTADQVAALPTIDAPSTPYRIWAGDN